MDETDAQVNDWLALVAKSFPEDDEIIVDERADVAVRGLENVNGHGFDTSRTIAGGILPSIAATKRDAWSELKHRMEGCFPKTPSFIIWHKAPAFEQVEDGWVGTAMFYIIPKEGDVNVAE